MGLRRWTEGIERERVRRWRVEDGVATLFERAKGNGKRRIWKGGYRIIRKVSKSV